MLWPWLTSSLLPTRSVFELQVRPYSLTQTYFLTQTYSLTDLFTTPYQSRLLSFFIFFISFCQSHLELQVRLLNFYLEVLSGEYK